MPYFTEYAIEDKNFQGHALARSMKNLATACETIIDDDDAASLFDPEIYAQVVVEAKGLMPHAKVLSGGQMQEVFAAYGRTGQPCPRCDATIERIVLGGRSTHLCGNCQF